MNKLYAGDSYLETLTFKDEDDELYDPTTIAVTFLDPDGVQSGDALDKDDLDRTSVGVFELIWKLPVDAAAGTWIRCVTATYEATGLVKTSQEPFSVNTKPYGTLSVVRRLCGLATDDNDEELLGFLEDATEFINLELENHVSTPLATVPTKIVTVANYYAAGLYLQRNMTENEGDHKYVKLAERKLAEYISRTYGSDLPILIYTPEED